MRPAVVLFSGGVDSTVTATLVDPPCNVTLSNGKAVRYQWQPPASLLNQLLGLVPTR